MAAIQLITNAPSHMVHRQNLQSLPLLRGEIPFLRSNHYSEQFRCRTLLSLPPYFCPYFFRRLGLRPVNAHVDYLTGAPSERSKLIRKFRIDVELKLNLKLLSKELRLRTIGQVVVKERGVDQAIFDNIQALKIAGANKATIIATRHNGKRLALITNIEERS